MIYAFYTKQDQAPGFVLDVHSLVFRACINQPAISFQTGEIQYVGGTAYGPRISVMIRSCATYSFGTNI